MEKVRLAQGPGDPDPTSGSLDAYEQAKLQLKAAVETAVDRIEADKAKADRATVLSGAISTKALKLLGLSPPPERLEPVEKLMNQPPEHTTEVVPEYETPAEVFPRHMNRSSVHKIGGGGVGGVGGVGGGVGEGSVFGWLETVKQGYGEKFAACFEEVGVEDASDIADGLGEEEMAELKVSLVAAGAKTRHMQKILRAAIAARSEDSEDEASSSVTSHLLAKEQVRVQEPEQEQPPPPTRSSCAAFEIVSL